MTGIHLWQPTHGKACAQNPHVPRLANTGQTGQIGSTVSETVRSGRDNGWSRFLCFFSRGGKKHDIWYPSRKKHLHWKSKIIFKSALGGDILVRRGVYDMWVCLGLCCESTSKYCIKDHHRYVCFTVPWFLPGLGNGIRTSQTKAPLILDFCAFIQIFTFIFHNIPLILCV